MFSADRKLDVAVTDSLVTLREKQKVFDGKFSVNAAFDIADLALDN